MPRHRAAVLVTAVLLLAQAARADVVAIVNDLRVSGCAGAPELAPLAADAALDAVARRLARGAELDAALAEAGYRSSRSGSIHIGGAADDDAIREVLVDGFCDALANPAYTAIGSYERDRRFWLVLARPYTPLAPAADGDDAAARVLELVNEARAEDRRCGRKRFKAARPLTLSVALTRAAAAHAADMAANEFMGHEGSDGSTAGERVLRAGYRWRAVGENVAAGQPDADAVVQAWLASPGHCANIMAPQFTELGVAFAPAPQGELRILWAQVFAARR